MSEAYPVCWQDTRLIVGPLNLVYQEMSRYNNIVEMWDQIPVGSEGVWTGQAYASPLILTASTNRPYGMDCYSVQIKRDITGYPVEIKFMSK